MPAQPQDFRDIVGRSARLNLVEKPELFLSERKRHGFEESRREMAGPLGPVGFSSRASSNARFSGERFANS